MKKEIVEDKFKISKNLEDCVDVIFREDEVKFLNKNNNKDFNRVFKNKSFSLEDVKSYLKTFFKKIEESNFPLGHKYVDFEKESESEDVADFSKICKNFYDKLTVYINTNKDTKYEI